VELELLQAFAEIRDGASTTKLYFVWAQGDFDHAYTFMNSVFCDVKTKLETATGLDTGHFFGPEPDPTRPGKLSHTLTRDPT